MTRLGFVRASAQLETRFIAARGSGQLETSVDLDRLDPARLGSARLVTRFVTIG